MLSKSDLEKNGKIPVYSSDTSNNGIIGYTNIDAEFIVSEENPIYLVFGDHTRSLNIVFHSFNVTDNVKVLSLKDSYSIKILLYIISSWQKGVPNLGYSRHWSIAKKVLFKVPVKNGVIDFAFMENFIAELEAERIAELEAERIAELEAYLQATGLQDYTLTKEEEKALQVFEGVMFEEFTYQNIFNKIIQGRRLRKEDQISGTIPFVMAGTTNTGVVNYISNPVASFPKNSITIDIFGNTFYRNYDFGAGDDTGVYWNDEKEYSKEIMLFCATAMEKSLFGKFSFGKKLRSSQSVDFKMFLPSTQGVPLYAYMEVFIRAVQKLVIKDVVQYADRKITATREVVTKS